MAKAWSLILIAGMFFMAESCAPRLSPYMQAASDGNVQGVLSALRAGANINEQALWDSSALVLASANGHVEVVKVLLDKGADINLRDLTGNTPLMVALSKNHLDIAHLLIDKGADVRTANRFESSALDNAISTGDVAIVKKILGHGAVFDAKRKADYLAGIVGPLGEKIEMLRFLLDIGLDVNAKGTTYDYAALHWVAMAGHMNSLKLLLERGADVNIKSSGGQTPLHVAAANGHDLIVRILLDRGGDPLISDPMGYTARKLADKNGHHRIVNILEAAENKRFSESYAGDALSKTTPRMMGKASDVDTPPGFVIKQRSNAYAIIIGIELYRQGLPAANYAVQDAQRIVDYFINALGYREDHVISLSNEHASYVDLVKYFEKWLPNNVEPGSSVFIYYSGHGAPNPKTGDAYLVPYDGDPSFIEETGYSLKRMYAALGKLPAKEVIVALDSCFSGAGGRSVLAKGARPLVMNLNIAAAPARNMTILAASSGEQISSTYDEKGHGLFTYFLLKGIKNEDVVRQDGSLDIATLFDYVKPQVTSIARKKYNNEQTPQLIGVGK